MLADNNNLQINNRLSFSITKLQTTGVAEKHKMVATYGLHFSVLLLCVQ